MAQTLVGLILPFAVLVGGIGILRVLDREPPVSVRFVPGAEKEDYEPLYSRCRYDASSARAHFRSLSESGLRAEARFLMLDLLFPLFYASAFAVGFRLVGIGPGTYPALPVVVAVSMAITDWTENAIQLGAIRRFRERQTVSRCWIALSSIATRVKFLLIGAASVALILQGFQSVWKEVLR